MMKLTRTRKILAVLFIQALLIASTAYLVRSSVDVGTYYLDVPLPLADYYIGQFSNGSVFAVNGSNWDCFLVSDNASYVYHQVNNNMTSGTLMFGSGTFDFTHQLWWKSNINYVGMGFATVFNCSYNQYSWYGKTSNWVARNRAVNLYGVDENITIKDIRFQWKNSGNNDNYLIEWRGISRSTIENCWFINNRKGFGVVLDSRNTTNNNITDSTRYNTVLKCHFSGNTVGNIQIKGGAEYNTVQDCYAEFSDGSYSVWEANNNAFIRCDAFNNTDSLRYTNHQGFTVHSSNDTLLESCTSVRGKQGLAICKSAGDHPQPFRTQVQNCRFWNHSEYSMTLTGNDHMISGNLFNQSGEVFMWLVKMGTLTFNTTFSGNTFYGRSAVTNGQLHLLGARHHVIGNKFIVYNVATNFGGIVLAGCNVSVIEHNSFTDGGDAIEIKSATTNVGNLIQLNQIYTSGGTIIGTTTGNIIRWNEGYTTENSGFTTIAHMENVTHGLVATPTYLQVTALNATYDTEPLIAYGNITAFDNTYFGVSCYWLNSTAITDDVVYICWEARTWN